MNDRMTLAGVYGVRLGVAFAMPGLTSVKFPADEHGRAVARVVNGAGEVRAERRGGRRGVRGHFVSAGAAGLIGSHLTDRLPAARHTVVGLDSLVQGPVCVLRLSAPAAGICMLAKRRRT